MTAITSRQSTITSRQSTISNHQPSSPCADLIEKHWGIRELRPLQAEAIAAGVSGRDSLVVMPTGGGKSLCFQVPALVRDGLTVVVCPLISLMQDQVDALTARGVPAAFLNSTQCPDEAARVAQDMRHGNIKLLYVSPERCMAPGFLDLLQHVAVRAFVIDEAHCISQWGHDFRPAYAELGALRPMFPEVSLHAFTASATRCVRDEIVSTLRLRDPAILVGDFDRPNLTYRVEARTDLDSQLRVFLRDRPDESGIIYCITKAETEQLAAMLQANHVDACAYHAGLCDDLRRYVQDWFMDPPIDNPQSSISNRKVVVATIAFGMGIDRSDVRFVVHAALPSSIECYHQETGRAGRDGLPADCVMFYDPSDVEAWFSIFSSGAPHPDVLRVKEESVCIMELFCQQDACRHRQLTDHFGQSPSGDNCSACDVCLD